VERATDDGALTIRCACGWEIHGREAEIVPAVQAHGRRVHNMDATREQVLAMAIVDDSTVSGGRDVVGESG
jgi:predicted small metal-binding protein